jgi:hypothetical protein
MIDEQSDLGKNRSPAAEARPEDPPEQDALKDEDITSGKVGTEAAYDQKGEAKEASDTTAQEAGSL